MLQVQTKTFESDGGIFNRALKNQTFIEFNGKTVSAKEYFPVWIHNLADDVTLEGSLINGFVQGAENVRAIVTGIRDVYERQEFGFAGPFRENLFFENYTAWTKGELIGCLVMIIRNAAGQAQHIAANYRPLKSSLLLSKLVREHFGDNPLTEHFVDKKFD
jgi:hypothetical protein